MKKINNTAKSNFFKKLFFKLCRKIGYEIIDQSNLVLPVSNRLATENLNKMGKNVISLPLGETKISRPIKSLDIIIKTCTAVNLVTQNKKRIFEKQKSEYTFRTIKSILNSLNHNKEVFKNIKLNIFVVDHNSKKEDLEIIKNILIKSKINFEIINLNVEEYKNIKTLNKNNPEIERNMKATMASIFKSFEIAAQRADDIIYFVEDDYIHKKECLGEMVIAYEKIASQLKKELFLCPVDYPYLYTKAEDTNILIGSKYHWRSINESLLTFMTSKKIVNKYWQDLKLMSENENSPFETPLHNIYRKEVCLSPVPSLAIHCTNVNSIFGLSPNIDWKEIWDASDD